MKLVPGLFGHRYATDGRARGAYKLAMLASRAVGQERTVGLAVGLRVGFTDNGLAVGAIARAAEASSSTRPRRRLRGIG